MNLTIQCLMNSGAGRSDEELAGDLTVCRANLRATVRLAPVYNPGAEAFHAWQIQSLKDACAELLLEQIVRSLLAAGRGAGVVDAFPACREVAELTGQSALDALECCAREASTRELEERDDAAAKEA